VAIQKSNLMSFGLIPMIAAGVGFVLAAALSIIVVQSGVDSAHRNTLGETLTSELAQQVNIKESQFKLQLEKIASSSLVRQALDGSPAKIIAAESEVSTLIPYAERVRLIPKGLAKTDQGFPPFNFIALDLVKSTEAGENPPPEAISSQPQLEGEKWVIVATPVNNANGSLKGTLFVYLNTYALSSGLTAGDKGQLRIMQTVGTKSKPIAQAGEGGSGNVFSIDLNNPNWKVEFLPSASIGQSSPIGLIIYLIPGLVMLLICLGGIFFASGRTGAAIQTNLSRLGAQIGKAATGSYDGEADYSLLGFADQDSKLKQFMDFAPASNAPALKPIDEASAAVLQPQVVEIEMSDDNPDEIEEIEVEDFDEAVAAATNSPTESVRADVPEGIFRAYDIRGVVGETLSEDIARQIGAAIGSEAFDRGQQTLLVGYDGREYSPALAEALIEGITESGRDAINIGSVPTPVLYYGTHNGDTQSGVMVTGSRNASDYNGFKVVLEGKSLVGDEVKALYQRIKDNNLTSGKGSVRASDFTQEYLDAIADDVVVAQPLKVVIDCGNGIAGSIGPELLDSLGCEAVPLYCEVDGTFPNHHPDPTKPENLVDLIKTVKSQGADLGIALDGDGDRLVAVTAEGEIVWPDRLLMLFAKDIVSRNPGSDVVYDVKCTRHLNSVISSFGGRPIICRSGHSYIKEKILETNALLGGELSGHICFSERWFGFDDGLYSAARLLEIVGSQEEGLADLLKEFPQSVATPEIHISVDDESKFELIDALVAAADFEDASITTLDGLRVDFTDGWGLIRASNTEPAITLRFEADSVEALEDIKAEFRELLQESRSDLDFE
jgi:phosphomannomutase/phosphoglucomutase